MDFRFTFEDNDTAHDDLLLRLGDSVWRCDSYYLALDEGVLEDQEDARKVRVVLCALLEKWRAAIGELTNGAIAYLPYDFSDQCTAWLACERDGGDLRIRHGWAEVEGWTMTPSDPPSLGEMPAGFRPDGGPWSLPIADFLKGIDCSIEAAG